MKNFICFYDQNIYSKFRKFKLYDLKKVYISGKSLLFRSSDISKTGGFMETKGMFCEKSKAKVY